MMLRCSSVEGTQPLQYFWERTTGNKLMPPLAVLGKFLLLVYPYRDLINRHKWCHQVPQLK